MKAPRMVYVDFYDNMVFLGRNDARNAVKDAEYNNADTPIAKYVLEEILYPKPKKGAKK